MLEKIGKREVLEVVGFIILYAISDEYHQSFVPGREASFREVCIDTLGGISGVLAVKTTTYTRNIYFLQEKYCETRLKSWCYYFIYKSPKK